MSEQILNGWEQYRSTIQEHALLSDDEMRLLAVQAKSGDAEAKELLIKQCMCYVLYDSAKYTQFAYNYDEHMELIGAGNAKVAAVLDVALTKRDPMPYIRAAIRNALIDQSVFYRKFVKWNVSLEASDLADRLAAETQQPQQVDDAKMRTVSEALDALTKKQRYVVMRHFGLDGDAPELLYALSKRMSTTGGNTQIAKGHIARALKRLQRVLG